MNIVLLCCADSAGAGGDGVLPGGLAAAHRRTGQHEAHVSFDPSFGGACV